MQALDLDEFILQPQNKPEEYITVNNTKVKNNDYVVWRKEDTLIMSWLILSISDNLIGQITRCQ